jgi:hypothetical protein
MKISKTLTAAAALITIAPSAAQPQSVETLQTRCAQKTLMYNRDGVKIAEGSDDYCLGFLEGSLTAMQRAKLICPEHPPDGDVLISVIDAAEAVAAAYQRAYPCKK